MQQKRNIPKALWITLSVYIVLILTIQVWTGYNVSIERWYSSMPYPFIAASLRIFFGWLPFSVGDVFYVLVLFFVLFKILRFIKSLFRRDMTWRLFGRKVLRFMFLVATLYIVFYCFWGLNYYRKGIAYQLKIEKKKYSTEELIHLTQELALKTSFYRKTLSTTQFDLPKNKLFEKAVLAYSFVQKDYSFIRFNYRSTKASLFGEMGNYLGYTGYYNPFSGEAQINMKTPKMELPSVVCHEMAHQLGYATEDEANFVGYLAASHSHDNVFLYSTYLDLYQYAASELFFRDSVQYRIVRQSLDTLVRKDIHDIKLFYLPYRTIMYKMVNVIYGAYLKANNQPQGIDTYSDVVSLLMAYRKKYGHL